MRGTWFLCALTIFWSGAIIAETLFGFEGNPPNGTDLIGAIFLTGAVIAIKIDRLSAGTTRGER